MFSKKKKSLIILDSGGDPIYAEPTVVGVPTLTHGTSGATSVAGAVPPVTGGILADDLIVAWTSNVYADTMPEGPAGFRRLKMVNGNNGGVGSDLGGRLLTGWYKVAVGGEAGTITFNLPEPPDNPAVTSVNTISVIMQVWRKTDPLAKWDVQCVDAVHRILDESLPNAPSAIVCKSLNKHNLKTRDHVVLLGVANTDVLTFTPRVATFNAGLGITTVNENLISALTTSGNDSYFFASHYKVTSGNQTDFIQYNTTAVGVTTQRAPWVSCLMMRIRVVAAEVYMPSGYDHLDPSCIVDSLIDTRGGIWGKAKMDSEGTGVTYGIENYPGTEIPHFYIKNNFADYMTTANRRGEFLFSMMPNRYRAGTKYFQGFRYKYLGRAAHPNQYIVWQLHPGSGGLPSSNHPIAYLECSRAGQYPSGIEGSPGASPPAGTLVLAWGMSRTVGSSASVREYVAFPDINFNGINKDLPFAIMVKFGTPTGRIVLQYAGVTIFDRSTQPTMAADPIELGSEVAGTGSVAGIGAEGKMVQYLHGLNTSGAVSDAKAHYDAYIAAGLTPEMKTYIAGAKRAIKTATDWDYDDAYDAATLLKMQIV